MNVLVLEDRGSVSYYLEEALRSEGHTVFSATGIPDADSYWQSECIDCIVVDSNMSPDGLDAQEIQATKAGLLTGWVWLQNHVFAEHPEMRGQTIVYTDYLERLEQNSSDAVREGGPYLLSKKGSTSPAERFLKLIAEIARKVGGRKS